LECVQFSVSAYYHNPESPPQASVEAIRKIMLPHLSIIKNNGTKKVNETEEVFPMRRHFFPMRRHLKGRED